MAIKELKLELAATDTKGAAAFIQKCFDRAGVNLKVKAMRDDENDSMIECRGKVMGQDVHFAFILDKATVGSKRPDVYTDGFDMPSGSEFFGASDAIEHAWDAIHVSLKKKREMNHSIKSFTQAAKAAQKAVDEMKEFAEWNLRMAKAFGMIYQGYGK